MDDHYTVTIKDDKGEKSYSVHRFVKKAIYYASFFLATIFFVGFSSILYLTFTVDSLEKNREGIKNAYYLLVKKEEQLNRSLDKTLSVLKGKKEELSLLMTSLSEIELMMGIQKDANSSVEERVNIAKMSSEHRATMLQLIPNGDPVLYSRITSNYGNRIHPIKRTKEFHKGIDLKAKSGTPVYATADGVVEWASMHKKSGYGNLIIIEHSYGFKTYFGHLKRIVVSGKEFVKKGQLIGYSGNTGLSSGPHLHYEIRYFYQTLNPIWFMKWSIKNYNEIFEKVKLVPWNSIIRATAHLQVKNPTKTIPLSREEENKRHKK